MRLPDSSSIPAVILSGGSEIVSLALAESLALARIPLVVISLGIGSLLRDVQPDLVYRRLDWPPVSGETARDQLLAILREIGAGQPRPWPVFATEDGSLRLLLEHRATLSTHLAIPGSGRLPMAGLDKAELYGWLREEGLAAWMAPSVVLEHPRQILDAARQLGDRVICKPALKPLAMEIPGMDSKILSPHRGETMEDFAGRLATVWPASSRWLAQQRLHPAPEGEAQWYGLRLADGQWRSATGFERWKQPREGGSGCWVELTEIPGLGDGIAEILQRLEFHGLMEMSFLLDEHGQWRLLEMNPRPWLQLALLERAGHGWVLGLYHSLLGQPSAIPAPALAVATLSWVNVERLLLAALSGEQGPRSVALRMGLSAWRSSQVRVVYDSPLRGVRRRWLGRMTRRCLAGLRSTAVGKAP